MEERKHLESLEVGRAALRMALTSTRSEELHMRSLLKMQGILSAGVDFGGDFLKSISKIMERAVVAAQRQGLVEENHVGAGAVAGAAHAALEQVKNKAVGFSVGGKIGIARRGEHLCVAIFMGVGVLSFNEMCVGLAHRSLADNGVASTASEG